MWLRHCGFAAGASEQRVTGNGLKRNGASPADGAAAEKRKNELRKLTNDSSFLVPHVPLVPYVPHVPSQNLTRMSATNGK